jgi:hypothetical protein
LDIEFANAHEGEIFLHILVSEFYVPNYVVSPLAVGRQDFAELVARSSAQFVERQV